METIYAPEIICSGAQKRDIWFETSRYTWLRTSTDVYARIILKSRSQGEEEIITIFTRNFIYDKNRTYHIEHTGIQLYATPLFSMTKEPLMVVRHHTRAVLLSLRPLLCFRVLLLLSSLPTISQAQITLDGSLGPRGALRGPNYTISDRMGQIRGPNLFHSFGQFNLPKGESATFTGPNTITNILSRVTGGSPSSIDGTIRSQIPRANFYLLNPSGVMFGPNTSLDVSGSFHVSTADYLRLSDGATFSAHPAVPTVLSVAPPAAFGFLGPTPAPISIQGSALQVPAGQTVSVIGGDIEIVGGMLVASGGRLNLASVATAGEVGMNPADPTAPLQVGRFAALGQIHLVDAQLDVSGIRGGTVVLRGGRLMLDNTSIAADTQGDVHGARVSIDIGVTADAVVTNGSLLTADVGGAGNAGSIRIAADSLKVSQASLIRSQSAADTTGDVGHIDITARLMQVTDGSQVSGDTHGAGWGCHGAGERGADHHRARC